MPTEEESQDGLQKIVGHDAILIKHTELEALLCASIAFQNECPEIYFRSYNGVHTEEEISLNNIWEIIHHDKLFQGKAFETGSKAKIVLRHFNSSRLLCKDERGNLILEKMITEVNSPRYEPVVFNVDPIQVGLKRLYANQTYKIVTEEDSC